MSLVLGTVLAVALPTRSGEYVIYRDYSWKVPTWVGFVYYNKTTYGAFVYTPEEKKRISILFSTKEKDGSLELTGQRIISKIEKDDVATVNYLMFLLPDLYKWSKKLAKTHPTSGTEKCKSNQFGGDIYVSYNSSLPIFGLTQLCDTNNDKILFDAQFIGMISQKDDSDFFQFQAPKQKKRGKKTIAINQSLKKQTMSVDGIRLRLDKQWKKIADNSFLLKDRALVSVDTVDASLFAKKKAEIVPTMRRFFSQSGKSRLLYIDTQKVKETKDVISIQSSVYDKKSHALSYDLKTCYKNADNTYTIVSLTVSKNEFERYPLYFRSCFERK